MRWLFLILIVSCGQHKEPKRLDLKDSDGDNIINFQEALNGEDKYIANVFPLKEISGTISFRVVNGTAKDYLLNIDNHLDLRAQNLELLSKHLKAVKKVPHFSERSTLQIRKPLLIQDIAETEFYDLNLSFHSVKEAPKQLYLHDEDEVIDQGSWSMDMAARVSRATLTRLLSGKAYFSLSKLPQERLESIKERTYRLFYSNQTESKILYVSRELPMNQFVKKYKIVPTSIDGIDLLTTPPATQNHWWSRQVGEDWILVFSSLSELKATHMKGYQLTPGQMKRVEGRMKSKITLVKHEEARVMLRIWPSTRLLRTVKERVVNEWRGQHEDRWECRNFLREVISEKKESIAAGDIPKYIEARQDGQPLQLIRNKQVVVIHVLDRPGPYLELQVKTAAAKLEFTLDDLPADTFKQIGRYKSECLDAISTKQLNIEAGLSFEVESYVEKL